MNRLGEAWLRTAGGIAVRLGLGIVAAHINTIVMTSDPDPFGWHGNEEQEQGAPARDLHYFDVDVSGIKGGETYDQFDAGRDRSNSGNFAGFGCIETCKGHEAGAAWAAAHGISDPSDCSGISWSFIEGCVSFAIENADPSAEDDATGQS